MTREEEIKLVADCAVTDERYNEFKEGLIWGAKWADTNPKKGMISIDKACERLRNNIVFYVETKYGEDFRVDIEQLLTDIRKAMEK